MATDNLTYWKENKLQEAINRTNEVEKIRCKFVEDYPIDKIIDLSFEDFLIAKTGVGNDDSFCYRLRYNMPTASMGNAWPNVFEIYYSNGLNIKLSSSYEKKYGDDYEAAFTGLKKEIVKLLRAAEIQDIKTIEKCEINSLFKYKLVAVYFNDIYFPVCTKAALKEYVTRLGLPYDNNEDMIHGIMRIMKWRDSVPEVSGWSSSTLMYFCDWLWVENKSADDGIVLDNITDEYIPTLVEYNPGIASEQYKEVMSDSSLIMKDKLDTVYLIYLSGGEASCKQLENEFGKNYSHYIMNAIATAKAVQRKTQVELSKRDNGGDRYWAILFQGREAKKNETGGFMWRLRPELKSAIIELESEGFFEDLSVNKTTIFDYNTILYGPPGTGKTYNTAIYAVAMCDGKRVEELTDYDLVMARYNELKEENRIAFTTFHQSYGYEEFIEGIKPVVDGDSTDISYTIEAGTFKKFCEMAKRPVDMHVDPNASIWFMRLDSDNAKVRKDECFSRNQLIIDIQEKDEWSNDRFVNQMQIGDYVLSYAGSSIYIDAIGVIEGEAVCDETKESYRWSRRVKWNRLPEKTDVKSINSNMYLPNFSIAKMNHMKVSDLLKLLPQESVADNSKPCVFIIDEINRGNISKIFGELITLIEDTKREGMSEAASVILPYSKEEFSVPSNVYILGTMNTADRSIALMDTALRRRFAFVEMMPKPEVLTAMGIGKITHNDKILDVANMLSIINKRIEFLFDREHTIGHAFFTGLIENPSVEKLAVIFKKNVIPLLQEYFYEDYEKIQLVLGDNKKTKDEYKFVIKNEVGAGSIFNGNPELDATCVYTVNDEAFMNIESYIEIDGTIGNN